MAQLISNAIVTTVFHIGSFSINSIYSTTEFLINGSNAHINVNDKDWWFKKILEFKKKYEELKIICICSYKLENKRMKLVPLQYDDELINYLD